MQENTLCRCGKPPTAARRNNVTGQLPLCLRCAAADRFVIKSSPRKDGPLPAHIQGTRTAAIHQGKAVYTHQAKSLEALAQGDNLVVATPTASGKTLIFHLQAFSMLEADPNARTLVLYPAKALANDQLDRWQAAAQECHAGPDVIAQITGDVPTRERTAILDHSRIILMTPDVLHAWLIRTATSPAQRRFLQYLRLVITDEAHVYEDVLGTNAAFMFRRLSAAANASSNQFGIQHLAATATILNPAAHMTQLTGLPFSEVTESDNGAPRQETTLYHVAPPSEDDSLEAAAAKMVVSIITADPGAQIIVFHDSRQGAERIAAHAARPSEVIPYRAGYLPNERREIEQALRENKIRAIITTSALEIGIDMPDLNYGINIGLPPTRKQCRQRMGRVGRSRDATFVILGDKNTFSRHGETMRHYYRNSVEETRLHLNNEYIAYQNAMCYLRESRGYQADNDQGSTPITWPPIFEASLRAATSADPPRALAPSHARSEDTPPQLAYSLRSSGEETLEIIPQVDGKDRQNLGTINASSAIREAFPGALYRHRGTSYNVTEWRRRAGKPYVRIVPTAAAAAATTRPLMRRLAVLRLLTATSSCAGLLPYPGAYAHTHIDLWTSAEGYAHLSRHEAEIYPYSEVNPELEPGLTRKAVSTPTSAFMLLLNAPWFRISPDESIDPKTDVATILSQDLAYQHSIAEQNLGRVTENILVLNAQGNAFLLPQAIVIYDAIHGGLGLTAPLAMGFRETTSRLAAGSRAPRTGRIPAAKPYRTAAGAAGRRPDGGPGRRRRSGVSGRQGSRGCAP